MGGSDGFVGSILMKWQKRRAVAERQTDRHTYKCLYIIEEEVVVVQKKWGSRRGEREKRREKKRDEGKGEGEGEGEGYALRRGPCFGPPIPMKVKSEVRVSKR